MKRPKTFRGVRNGNYIGLRVFIEFEDGSVMPLIEPLWHSPDGFECGYEGSGPTDLALAMAKAVCPAVEGERVHVFNGGAFSVGQRAWLTHTYVRSQVVAGLPQNDGWAFSAARVRDVVAEALAKLADVECPQLPQRKLEAK